MRQKKSASVDVGQSGGSSVRRPVNEDPHRHQRNFYVHLASCLYVQLINTWCQAGLSRGFIDYSESKVGSILLPYKGEGGEVLQHYTIVID